MRKTTVLTALVATGLLLGVMAPSLGRAASPDRADGASPTTTVVPTSSESREVERSPKPAERTPADELEQAARASFGERFAGVSAVGGELTVHVKAAPSSAVASAFEGRRVVPAQVSWDELDAAKVRLDLDHQKLTDRGVVLASWGVDVAANALRIEVVAEGARLEEAEGAIAHLVPGVPLVVVPVEGLATATARHNDTAGWGAAKIVSGQACTAGVGWENRYGDELMLTAGHCALSTPAVWTNGAGAGWGWQIWNGLDGAAPWHNDLAAMSSYYGYVGAFYIAGPTNCCGVTVTGWYLGSQAGATGIRTSGAVTGEIQIAPGAVLLENQSVSFSWGVVNGLTYADCYGRAGDSGAPVYRVGPGGTILVMGILVGSPAGVAGATHCYYTPTSIVYAHHGGGAL